MANDPKADLIYAILSMDSYNRGYGAGVAGLGTGVTVKVGNYSIIQDVSDVGWFESGFYGIAYKNDDTGEVVISYRGTDFNLRAGGIWDGEYTSDPVQGGSDLVGGYGLALGRTEGNLDRISPSMSVSL